ncbi:unnamed protein product [Camellia sinensis]
MLLSPPSWSPAAETPIHLVVGHRRLRSISQGSSIGGSSLAAPQIASTSEIEATRLRLPSIAFSLILLLDATTAYMLDCNG